MTFLNQIANDVFEGGLNAIGNFVGLNNLRHPTENNFATVINKITPNDGTWRKSLGYQFRVVRMKGSKSTLANGWQTFTLQINPQELSQDEIFAIEVTPTFSGILVEHQGITLKDIMMSGTTGISPGRRGGGALSANGAAAGAAGISGYQEFHELRNYIRTYVEAKRNDPEKRKLGELRLIFDNLKDHESLFVEPQRFTMRRSASKPFLYDYNIQMKGIGVADEFEPDGGFLNFLSNADFWIDKTIGHIDDITRIIEGNLDLLLRVERDVESLLVDSFRSVGDAMRAVKTGDQELIKQQSRVLKNLTLKNLVSETTRVSDRVVEFSNRDIADYQAAKGQSSIFSDEVKIQQAGYKELKVARLGSLARRAINILLSQKRDFLVQDNTLDLIAIINGVYDSADTSKANSAAQELLVNLKSQYEKALSAGQTSVAQSLKDQTDALEEEITSASGRAIFIERIKSAPAVKPVIVAPGDTIQIIAAKFLNDPQRYKDLVTLNSLIPPYVDPTTLDIDPVIIPGVLRPGQKILIPTESAPTKPQNVTETNQDSAPIIKQMTQIERFFGVDLAVDDNFDIILTPTKDLDLISSVQNVAQAVVIKILLEPGSLKLHPEIGTNLSIGQKTTDLNKVIDQVRQSLQTDTRVESVIYVSATQEGNATLLDIVLKMKGIDKEVSFPLRIPAAA